MTTTGGGRRRRRTARPEPRRTVRTQAAAALDYARLPMDTRGLIDAIVQQTTVLVAQLATAAGIRAPLAHVADEVFLHLATELEQQGVRKKVAADMFGLALRSYQKKVRRLVESKTSRDQTLWEAVLGHVGAKGRIARSALLHDFRADDEATVAAIVGDLVGSGLVTASDEDDPVFTIVRDAAVDPSAVEVLATKLWHALDVEPCTEDMLRASFDEEDFDAALAELRARGHVEEDAQGRLRAVLFTVPVGARQGWEAAVFDHYRALAKAVAAKVQAGPRSELADRVGGATLSFDLHPEHPHRERVEGLLAKVRGEVGALWDEVAAYNRAHPYDGEAREKVTFYFGQNLERG
ncbi:MAG: hypothetical protein H6721_17345 [Sandaracinus sp.]|nr:hypothetical protein [Sandaracinus sp.]MCB9622825.1 hypothetical protein [Sandaracinus sp.]MCB9633887.1 hypothetical protein [Sandaracinus sp.]